MRHLISNGMVSKLSATGKIYDIYDTKVPGFCVRVNKEGRKYYRYIYQRKRQRQIFALGNADAINANEAREKAQLILANLEMGIMPIKKESRLKEPTLEEFLDLRYAEWRRANYKAGDYEIKRLISVFISKFAKTTLSKITSDKIDQLRTKWLQNKIEKSTINRDIGSLKTLLNKAIEWGYLKENPMGSITPYRIASDEPPRFLGSIDDEYAWEAHEENRYRYKNDVIYDAEPEKIRLFKAMDIHEKEQAEKQRIVNSSRESKGLPPYYPTPHQYYMRPMILLALNTGIRKSVLFSLTWEQVSFKLRQLTVLASQTKTEKSRTIPLNNTAITALKNWQNITGEKQGLIFKGRDDKPFNNVEKAWRSIKKIAKINNFRWHDMRHTFASELVMAGADLNTVRELLGHASIKMTLKYAHLAAQHKRDAVLRLDDL